MYNYDLLANFEMFPEYVKFHLFTRGQEGREQLKRVQHYGNSALSKVKKVCLFDIPSSAEGAQRKMCSAVKIE